MRIAARALLALAVVLVALPLVGSEPAAAAAPVRPLAANAVRKAPAELVGYLPTWELASTPAASLRYDLLTTIALFDVPVRRDGSLDRTGGPYRGVTSDRAAAIIARAHAAGVRVVITFSSFGAVQNAAFLASRAARDRFVREAVTLVASRGADGIDLDIESMRPADLSGYGQLVRSMTTAARRVDRAARISVATEANVVGARMAARAIQSGADRVFVMAYGMRSATAATAGSIDPIDRTASTYSIRAALDLYLSRGVPASRTVLGLPLYGMAWSTAGPGLNAASRGRGSVVLASRLRALVPRDAQSERDPVEGTSRWVWYDRAAKTWRQAYLDDATAIGARIRLGLGRKLAGVGLWALGYERGVGSYWPAIASALGYDTTAPVIKSVAVRWDRAHRRWQVTWSASDTGGGVARYVVWYRIGNGKYRTLLEGRATSATIAAPSRTRITVAVRAFDATGNDSGWRYATGRR